jgi:Family of unknown function (DUF6334)
VDQAVRELARDSGVLRRITGQPDGAGYTTLQFSFDHGTLRLSCDADTDEIVATTGVASDVDSASLDADELLAPLLGKVIELVWELSNDRGYTDGFQIRCLDLETGEESCCQFEVAAAAMTIARVG